MMHCCSLMLLLLHIHRAIIPCADNASYKSHLLIEDGLMCLQYQPGPVCKLTTIPIIPSSYHQSLLLQYRSQPFAGHLGIILKVPLSFNNHFIQDYFSKWEGDIPLLNLTVHCITKELVKMFATYGMPKHPAFRTGL